MYYYKDLDTNPTQDLQLISNKTCIAIIWFPFASI